MSDPSESPESDTAGQTTREENLPDVGLATRVISWAVDILLINLVAIITGLGAQLIASIFPITKNLKPLFLAIAAGVYVVWTAAYFVVFWSMSGQTPGARLMQVRLVTPGGGKVKPVRALVRWIGMNVGDVAPALGLRTDPVQAPGIPRLARPHACDRGPTAVYRRSTSGEQAQDTQRLPTTLSTR